MPGGLNPRPQRFSNRLGGVTSQGLTWPLLLRPPSLDSGIAAAWLADCSRGGTGEMLTGNRGKNWNRGKPIGMGNRGAGEIGLQ